MWDIILNFCKRCVFSDYIVGDSSIGDYHCDLLWNKNNKETPRIALTMNIAINTEEKHAGTYSLMTRLLLQGTKKYNNEEISSEEKWTEQQCYIVAFLLTLKYTDLLFYTELMSGNYSRHITKVKDEVSKISNNYSKLLNHKIDEKHTYSSILSKLNLYLEHEYIDINKAYGTFWNYENEDNEFTRKQQRARDMHHYIPQVEPDKTFKENIEKLIN